MWLTCQYKILTKDQLRTRGWSGYSKCPFCNHDKTVNHLFITCSFARQIWFWMGNSVHFFTSWHHMEDILEFAVHLSKSEQSAFLMVLSALCWTIWKHRNEICFQHVQPKTGRTLIFLIISLIKYWLGSKRVDQATQMATQGWLPTDAMLELIPIRVWVPGDDQLLPFPPESTPAD